MKRTAKVVLILILIIICIPFAVIKYRVSYAKTEIETVFSNDKEYKLIIYEIGEPDWPFGDTHCRFALFKNEKKINKLNFDIHNDGSWACSENFNIYWETDNVKIAISGDEQENLTYYLYFNGNIDIKQ